MPKFWKFWKLKGAEIIIMKYFGHVWLERRLLSLLFFTYTGLSPQQLHTHAQSRPLVPVGFIYTKAHTYVAHSIIHPDMNHICLISSTHDHQNTLAREAIAFDKCAIYKLFARRTQGPLLGK